MRNSILVAICFLVLCFPVSGLPPIRAVEPPEISAVDKYYRTELYFGRSIKGGGEVSDEDWKKFVSEVVTPRFPDGFTVLKASGQYRDKDGNIIAEPGMMIVFLYSAKTKKAASKKLDEIRKEYVTRFSQESVLRVDMPARASF